jgi:hypothetical protein
MYNPYPNSPYSTLGNSRNQFMQQKIQQQPQQNQYDFSGWGDRLTSIEQGIKGLTEHFKNINVPGAEVGEEAPAPEYAGNMAPAPLAAAPLAAAPLASAPVDPGFNFDPSGGSLFDQMSTAYGQPATMTQQFQQENPNANYIPKGGQDFTQGFQDFIGQQGYFVDDKSSFDAGMGISQTPTQDYGVKGFGFNQPQQQVGLGINGLASLLSNKGSTI